MSISYEDFYAAHPIEDTAENRAFAAEFDLSFDIAQLVYDLRKQAGLTQTQLAKRMGTTQSVIARLESAGHKPNIAILERAARALGVRIRITAEPPMDTPPSPSQGWHHSNSPIFPHLRGWSYRRRVDWGGGPLQRLVRDSREDEGKAVLKK